MLIYGVSGTFAHKKTIKQFLQPMIQQVFGRGGGGDVPGGCAAIFGSVYQSYYNFVSVFSTHRCLFGGRFYQYLHIFGCIIIRISSKGQTLFWAQKFLDVQLIPNFLRYPIWL